MLIMNKTEIDTKQPSHNNTSPESSSTKASPENTKASPDDTKARPDDTTASPTEKKKITSRKRIEANRRNASRSTGPRNTERTRYNAMKHGFRAEGLTDLDNHDEYFAIIRQLMPRCPANDPVCQFLVERIALDMTRARRTASLQAQAMNSYSSHITDPVFMKEVLGALFDRFERYDTATMNRLQRCLRQLEEIIEKGNNPATTGVDTATQVLFGDSQAAEEQKRCN